MASKTTASLLALNLLFFSLVNANPNPAPCLGLP
ncbi:unnamed protein product [Prunus brigantina]